MQAKIVFSTCPGGAEAERLAELLVHEKLAGCVNIVPGLSSIYRWKDAIEKDAESLLIIKTSADRLPDLQKTLIAEHPYETPEFVVLDIERMSEGYAAWLSSVLGRE